MYAKKIEKEINIKIDNNQYIEEEKKLTKDESPESPRAFNRNAFKF